MPSLQSPDAEAHPLISFAHIKNARARRAKEFAQKLLFLADEYPELARLLDKPIKAAIKQSKRTPVSDRQRVYSALENHCHTYAEIVERTKLPYHTVHKIVNHPEMVLLVEFRRRPLKGEPGRGGPRNPEVLIFLKSSLG